MLLALKKYCKKFFMVIIGIAVLPASLLFYLAGYRRAIIFTGRIGHLAIEPDTMIKAQQLGLIPQRKWIITARPHQVANQHLLNYWKKYFTIIQSRPGCLLIKCLTTWDFMRYDATHFVNAEEGCQFAYEVNNKWGDKREPLLTLSEDDEKYAKELFANLGLPDNAWFVCVHAREGGFSPEDEHLHTYRNSNIDNLIPSINEIIQRGGWVVRLGDPTTKQLAPMPQVIDYAHHPLRNPRLDVILCAKAKFILGNTSGIFLVGSVFGTPSALVNMAPFAVLGFTHKDISIPKLIRCKNNNDYLTFKDIMASDFASCRYAAIYATKPILVEENSAEDILDVTREMFERLNGSFTQSVEDQTRHNTYIGLFDRQHYSYGANSSVGREFLLKYEHLLYG